MAEDVRTDLKSQEKKKFNALGYSSKNDSVYYEPGAIFEDLHEEVDRIQNKGKKKK